MRSVKRQEMRALDSTFITKTSLCFAMGAFLYKNISHTSLLYMFTMGFSLSVTFLVFIGLQTVYRKARSGIVKPWFSCFMDSFLYIPSVLKIGPYKITGNKDGIDAAIINAVKSTGLADFGVDNNKQKQEETSLNSKSDHSFAQLYRIIHSVGRDEQMKTVRYSPTGYLLEERSWTYKMETRLQLVDYIKRHPSIRNVTFDRPPIFIIGLARTGTTYLHELLGLHPETRSHYVWEQQHPVPTTDDESASAQQFDRERRYKEGKPRYEKGQRIAGDYLQRIHKVCYDASEECTVPCSVEAPWSVSALTFMVCSSEKLFNYSLGQTYQLYSRFLQILTWQAPDLASTWMLKCPFHLPYLIELHATFPDSPLIWTHRHPCECIPSACSLFYALASLTANSWTIDKKVIGLNVVRYTRICLERAFTAIEQNKKDTTKSNLQVVHIKYKNTINKPVEECEAISKVLGLSFDAEYAATLNTYVAKSKAKRRKMVNSGTSERIGKMHSYSLEEFGLSKENIEEEFATYIEKYC